MAAVLRRCSPSLRSIVYCSFLAPKQYSKPQTAGMIIKALRDPDYKRPPPYPYKEQPYGLLQSFFDKTSWRFDENTKLIVIDGPVASGKAKLAEKVAEEFDLHYIPHAHMDEVFINSYGYDLRTLNDEMPPKARSFDVHEFHANPFDQRSTLMQRRFFQIRLRRYIDALAHILSTGQGVVMNRSVFSDIVFYETHMKFGFLPRTFKRFYEETWACIKPDLMRPHLIVYIDTPVDIIRQNLVKRKDPVLINSPALQPPVLSEFEKNYKKFLEQISTHTELLVYDGSKDVDHEIVIEDLERINLDDFERYSSKMSDWRENDEDYWTENRTKYTKDRHLLEIWGENVPAYQCPEAYFDAEEADQFFKVRAKLPGNKYQTGYNENLGDTNILFKY